MITKELTYYTYDKQTWDFDNALHFKCCTVVHSFDKKKLRIVANKPHEGVIMEWSGSKLNKLKEFLNACGRE